MRTNHLIAFQDAQIHAVSKSQPSYCHDQLMPILINKNVKTNEVLFVKKNNEKV